MAKFKNKYRGQTTRLQFWDYGAAAIYLIGLCTKDRNHFFGEVENEKMILTDIGKIAAIEWLKTPFIRPDMNLKLGEFIIMPDHFHGIISIGHNKHNSFNLYGASDFSDEPKIIHTHRRPTIRNKFGSQSKNLGSIIRGFKSAVTTYARKNNIKFKWQRRYWDHIIRDELELRKISRYIKNNPANWGKKK